MGRRAGAPARSVRAAAAIRHPGVAILAHPTGRLVNRRRPFDIDFAVVAKAAADADVALAVNAQPDRLDLDDGLLRVALATGATCRPAGLPARRGSRPTVHDAGTVPRLTRWFIRSALACLVAGVLVHVFIALRPMGPAGRALHLQPAALHLVVVGFLTQIVFGVALWLFPKAPCHRREPGAAGWCVFALLDVGILLRVLAEPFAATSPGRGVATALVVSALFQWLAAVGFAVLAWPRVRAR